MSVLLAPQLPSYSSPCFQGVGDWHLSSVIFSFKCLTRSIFTSQVVLLKMLAVPDNLQITWIRTAILLILKKTMDLMTWRWTRSYRIGISSIRVLSCWLWRLEVEEVAVRYMLCCRQTCCQVRRGDISHFQSPPSKSRSIKIQFWMLMATLRHSGQSVSETTGYVKDLGTFFSPISGDKTGYSWQGIGIFLALFWTTEPGKSTLLLDLTKSLSCLNLTRPQTFNI